MPRNSGLTKRDVVNHGQNGKGDASRITDVQAYRQNFDEIDWRPRVAFRPDNVLPLLYKRAERLKTLREIEDEEFAWRHGL